MRFFAAFFLLAAVPGLRAEPYAPAAGKPAVSKGELSEAQFREGMDQLRGYLEKRGEEPAVIEKFVGDIERYTLAGAYGPRRIPTRDVFAAFLKYESAWARKTRDSKNNQVGKEQLQHEIELSAQFKETFKQRARAESPGFLAAYLRTIQDISKERARRNPSGSAAVFFGDQVDNSYSLVDAGDEALDNGDAAKAVALANQALTENPGNADAFVLRSGAEYDQRLFPAAQRDAQAALSLDPGNQQAQAIMSLSGGNAPKMAATMAKAASTAGGLQAGQTSARAPASALVSAVRVAAVPAVAAGLDRRAPPPSPTPALGVRLSSDLTLQAAGSMSHDPGGSIGQLDRAIALDPRNAQALTLRSLSASRDKDYPSARASADLALLSEPTNAGALFSRAYAQAGLGDNDGALESLRQAASFDPTYQKAADAAAKLPPNSDLTPAFVDPLDGVFAAAARHPHHKPRKNGFRLPEITPVGALKLGVLAMLALLLYSGRGRFFADHGRDV